MAVGPGEAAQQAAVGQRRRDRLDHGHPIGWWAGESVDRDGHGRSLGRRSKIWTGTRQNRLRCH